MARDLQDRAIVEYSGPQGSVELQTCTQLTVDRTKTTNRRAGMNRSKGSLGFQRGKQQVSLTLTIAPELGDPEIDWVKAWRDDEYFTLVQEKGLDGERERFRDCIVESVNDSYDDDGNAQLEVSVQATEEIQE